MPTDPFSSINNVFGDVTTGSTSTTSTSTTTNTNTNTTNTNNSDGKLVWEFNSKTIITSESIINPTTSSDNGAFVFETGGSQVITNQELNEKKETGNNVQINLQVVPAENLQPFALPTLPAKESPEDLVEYLNGGNNEVGATIYILNSKGMVTHITNKFYLVGMSIALKERAQVFEALESINVSFFGESARVYTFQGVTVDWESQNRQAPYRYFWNSSLMKMYNEVLRGTKLIESKSIAVLKVNNHLISGYPLNYNTNYTANDDKIASFGMSWVIKDHSLALPGVVNEVDLHNMYLSNTDKITQPYVKNINAVMQLINSFLMWGNVYGTVDNKILNYLQIEDLSYLSYHLIKAMPNSLYAIFGSMMSTGIMTVLSTLGGYMADPNVITAPFLRTYFNSKEGLDTRANLLNKALTEMKTVPDAYYYFMDFITVLNSIKKDLLIFKARLVY